MSRISDGPGYNFGPYEDEYRGFDQGGEDSSRGWLILALAVGVLLIFTAVVWNTYRQGVRPAEGGLPVITGDTQPYKRAPDDPGGQQVAGQDRSVYSLIDGQGDPAELKPVAATAPRNPIPIRRSEPVLEGGLPPLPQATEALAPETITSNALEGLDPRKPEMKAFEETKTAAIGPVELRPKPLRPVPEEGARLPEPETVSRFAPSGQYYVQLMAVRSEAAAGSEWLKIKAAEPVLYDGAKLSIQKADLGARGIFYRLRVGRFADRDKAKAFCSDVKATGRDCIVVSEAIG